MGDQGWVEKQKKTFTKWVNAKLSQGSDPRRVQNIVNDLQDGVIIIRLISILYPDHTVPPYNPAPKMRVNYLDNVTLALNLIESIGIKVAFIKPLNIVDCNATMVLGLIWTLICEAGIKGALKALGITPTLPAPSTSIVTGNSDLPPLRVQGKLVSQAPSVSDGIKEALRKWCQDRVAPYGVRVDNFQSSFSDGLVLCALVNSINPSIGKYPPPHDTPSANVEYAICAAELLGIPRLIDVEDIIFEPDDKSIMTYVSEFLKYITLMNFNNPFTGSAVPLYPSSVAPVPSSSSSHEISPPVTQPPARSAPAQQIPPASSQHLPPVQSNLYPNLQQLVNPPPNYPPQQQYHPPNIPPPQQYPPPGYGHPHPPPMSYPPAPMYYAPPPIQQRGPPGVIVVNANMPPQQLQKSASCPKCKKVLLMPFTTPAKAKVTCACGKSFYVV